MAFGDFKYLTKRTTSDKILCDKAFNIAKNPKYDGGKKGHPSMVYKFFEKKSAALARSETLAMQDKSAFGVVLKMRIFQIKN